MNRRLHKFPGGVMSAALAKREFVAGLIAGVSVGFALWLLEKLQRRGGSSKNPLWGRASVRQPDAAALAAAVGGGVPRQPSREGVQRQVSREKMVANDSAVPLPAALLKKHPKGCGVDLYKVDSIRVTDVYMLPVARLSRGDVPIAPTRTNTMGDDGRSGYNQLIDKEDLILGDIVRKPGIGQFFCEVGFTMPAFTEVKLQILGQGGVALVVAGRLIHDCLLAPTGLSLVPSTLGKTVAPTGQALWHHL